MQSTQTDALNQVIADHTRRGYRIVSQTNTSVQLAKPKRLNPLGMILFFAVPGAIGLVALLISPSVGLILLLLAGIGLLLVLADYALRKEELIFITAEDAQRILRP